MSGTSRITATRRVTRLRVGGAPIERADVLTIEEPLEIRLGRKPLAVTMRTPGSDIELAAGFLLTEGIIRAADDFMRATYCAGSVGEDGTNTYNVLEISLASHVPPPDPSVERNFYTTSSCGVCGKASIESITTTSQFQVETDTVSVKAATLAGFPQAMRANQRVFDRTGGLHAAAIFNGSTGELLVIREDVGRHNAVDKVIGWALLNGKLPLSGCVLVVSGRASFELTQKAAMAGIPMLCAVSAPSSLAADLAETVGMTLVGFLRDESMVIYTRPDRITPSETTLSEEVPL